MYANQKMLSLIDSTQYSEEATVSEEKGYMWFFFILFGLGMVLALFVSPWWFVLDVFAFAHGSVSAVRFRRSRSHARGVEEDLARLRNVFGNPSVRGLIGLLESPVTLTDLGETASKFHQCAIEELVKSRDTTAQLFLQEFCKEEIRVEERWVDGGPSAAVQGIDHCWDPGYLETLTIHSFPKSGGVLPDYNNDREAPIHKVARSV